MRRFKIKKTNNRGGIAYIKIIVVFSVLASLLFCFKLMEKNSDKLIIRNLIINDKIKNNNIYQVIKHSTHNKAVNLVEDTILETINEYSHLNHNVNTSELAVFNEVTYSDEIYDYNKQYISKIIEKLRYDHKAFKVDSSDLSEFGEYESYYIFYSEDNTEELIRFCEELYNSDDDLDEHIDTDIDYVHADSVVFRTKIIIRRLSSSNIMYKKKSYMAEIKIPLYPFNGNGERNDIDYRNIVNIDMLMKYGDGNVD